MIQAFDGLLQLLDRVMPRTGNHQRGANLAADNRGVGYSKDWRGIDDQGVELLAKLFEQLLETQVHQQFRGVRRNLAGCYHQQVRDCSGLDDVFEGDGSGHVFAHTHFATQAEFLVDVASAQVGVDDHNARSGLGQHGAEVFGDEALANARAGAGDQQRVVRGVHQRKVNRGSQATQTFDGVVFGVGHGQQFARPLRLAGAAE